MKESLEDDYRPLITRLSQSERLEYLIHASEQVLSHWRGRDCGAEWYRQFERAVEKVKQ